MDKKHYGLILAGGQGTRFWPWSTETKPKQFLNIVGKEPLITQTFNRLKNIIRSENIFIVADKKYLPAVKEAIPEFNEDRFIAEPCPKNTAPSLILSNIALASVEPNANVAVVPADHFIPDTEVFTRQIKDALRFADNKFIITSGIAPTMPHTGYGYIKFDANAPETLGETEFHHLEAFKEKPALATAEEYVSQGNYYWNSGMFFYNVNHFKSFFQTYAPYYFQQYCLLEDAYNDPDQFKEIFYAIKPESIDYALMEKVKEVKMFKAAFQWNDVGAWSSVYELKAKDENGNVTERRDTIFIDSKDSMIFSTQQKPIAVIGLENVAVIDTENGILIAHMDQLQKVKEASTRLKESAETS